MHEKSKELAQAFVQGRTSRRELIKGFVALGVTATTADVLVNAAMTEALAADFDWKKNAGKTINLLLNKHPYTDAMLANVGNFKSLTGMDIKYDVFPEDVYFDKVTSALSSRSSQYDVLMTGAYQTWQYGPAGWLVDLSQFIKDPAATAPTYAWDDILPNLRAATAWSGVPGAELGGNGAKQWALPWGFELNSVSYNKRVFDQLKLDAPKNLGDMREKAAKITKDMPGMYGIGVRGSRSWAPRTSPCRTASSRRR
jgi:multiple sugar transport system substrate-binding protein